MLSADKLNTKLLKKMDEIIKILEEIKEYQMQNIQLAKTTDIYKLAEKAMNKALSIADVSNRRELLLDFAEYSENDKTSEHLDELVDNYLDSIK